MQELNNYCLMMPLKASPLPESYILPVYKFTYKENGITSYELVGYKLRYVTVILPTRNN